MNKKRREAIQDIISSLEELKEQIEEVRDEEQEYYDNMPESLQNGDKGQAADNAIGELQSALDKLDDVITHLNDAKGD